MSTANLRWAALGAAGLMVIGGFGVWATAGDGLISVNGSDRDGAFIIGCAVVYAVAVLLRPRRWLLFVAALAAAIATVTAIVDLQDVESEPLLDAGWGLWLDVVASVVALLLVAGLRGRRRAR